MSDSSATKGGRDWLDLSGQQPSPTAPEAALGWPERAGMTRAARSAKDAFARVALRGREGWQRFGCASRSAIGRMQRLAWKPRADGAADASTGNGVARRVIAALSSACLSTAGWLQARFPRRAPILTALVAAAAFVSLSAVAFLAYCLLTLPSEGGMTAQNTPSAVFVTTGDGHPIATRGVIKGERISADRLPKNLVAAVVAIEDRRFFSHHGIDFRGIARAMWRNSRGGREGASTITQQLARLTYLSQERSLRRKVQEAALALWLDATLSKKEILARYLNSAYFGAGAWGADAASRRYFGKPASDLDLSEAAVLAGVIRSPSTLALHRNLEGARERAELVLEAMAATGAATAEEVAAARQNPVSLWTPPETPTGLGYALDIVEATARKAAKDPTVDLQVATTLDLRLQSATERVVNRVLKQEGAAKNVSQAAVVVLAPDGAVLAMVGGRDYAQSQFNRAVQAKRQPGSLFKLFVYYAALQRGATPQSIVVDRPVQIGSWEPENYGGRYRGPMPLRSAFANSVNTVAVELSQAVGVDSVIETARKLGVESDLPKVPSIALGSAEVTLMEMVRSYAALAARADRIEPYLIRPATAPRAVPSRNDQATDAMIELLISAVQEGTGKAARLPNVPAGGKTGTTQDNRDAWFIGFTPFGTIGVWVGNDDNTPTKGVTGGDMPARIWRAVAADQIRLRAPDGPVLAAFAPPAESSGESRSRTQHASSAPNGPLHGRAVVRDTATLEIAGQPIRLSGLAGVGGSEARNLARYLGRRSIVCEPDPEAPPAFECTVDGLDLARLIVFNGGARTGPEASDELRQAELAAREARMGLWGR